MVSAIDSMSISSRYNTYNTSTLVSGNNCLISSAMKESISLENLMCKCCLCGCLCADSYTCVSFTVR